jgi:photosystem II stability/assembly factor-like uncharacterized protein
VVTAGASGSSASAAERFKAWTPIHAFLGGQVASGAVISPPEGIVVTRDNHVGLTTDAGGTWGFERMTTGSAAAVAGAPGGPFVVVGGRGFIALSADGKLWNDLPRYTSDDLRALAVADGVIVALGKSGGFVKVKTDGTELVKGALPDKLKATSVRLEHGTIYLGSGKRLFQSTDAVAWTEIEPPEPTLRATSQGVCSVGKLGKSKGVVCTVAGKAYGIGATETVVVGKSWIAVTTTGKRWSLAPLPLAAIKNVAGQPGGPYHVGDGRGGVASSTDGVTWTVGDDPTVLDGVAEFTPRSDKCEGALPGPQETCALTRVVTSPAGLPAVQSVAWKGEVGLAMGDSALVAMTTDGGASWQAKNGFGLGGVFGVAVVDSKIVALGRTKVAVSTDGGATFRTVALPAKTPTLFATHIAADGSVWLAGRTGTILRSDPEVQTFTKLATGAGNRIDYVYLHEVGPSVYAAGAKGELSRSIDGGATWTAVATGLVDPVQKMTGEGDTVLAVTRAGRYGGNKLLRSTDGGARFFVQRELSDQGVVNELELAGDTLRLDNLDSQDFGATWTRHAEWYWPGAIDIADGSGIRVTNIGSYNGKDRFYVIGTDKDDLTIVDSFYNKGAFLRCSAPSGCWMIAGGQLYHPRA